MAPTQMQLIQSLGDAMAWLEREISWGVPPTELRHLCGRIGELYVAVITNGRMATEVNQKGYDVMSSAKERISVKTTAMMGSDGHISFNANSLELVDRVIVLRVNTKEMEVETLLDAPVSEALNQMSSSDDGRKSIPLGRLVKKPPVARDIKAVAEASFGGYVIKELETGSIEVLRNGVSLDPVKPVLRELAISLNVELLNSNGNPLNTRQLGSNIIKNIQERSASDAQQGAAPTVAQPVVANGSNDFPAVGTEAWGIMNRRRAELIRKKNRQTLTPDEQTEYERLQRLSQAALEQTFPAPPGEEEHLDRLEARLRAAPEAKAE